MDFARNIKNQSRWNPEIHLQTVNLSPSVSDEKKPSSTESTTGNNKSSHPPEEQRRKTATASGSPPTNSISNPKKASVDSPNPKLKRHAGPSGRNSFRSSSSSHRRGR